MLVCFWHVLTPGVRNVCQICQEKLYLGVSSTFQERGCRAPSLIYKCIYLYTRMRVCLNLCLSDHHGGSKTSFSRARLSRPLSHIQMYIFIYTYASVFESLFV
jgi:hypothetical protein